MMFWLGFYFGGVVCGLLIQLLAAAEIEMPPTRVVVIIVLAWPVSLPMALWVALRP